MINSLQKSHLVDEAVSLFTNERVSKMKTESTENWYLSVWDTLVINEKPPKEEFEPNSKNSSTPNPSRNFAPSEIPFSTKLINTLSQTGLTPPPRLDRRGSITAKPFVIFPRIQRIQKTRFGLDDQMRLSTLSSSRKLLLKQLRPRTRKLLLKQLRPRTRKLLLKQLRPRTRKLLLKQLRPRTPKPLLKQPRPLTPKLLLKQLRPRTPKPLLKQLRPRTRKLLLKQLRPRTRKLLLKQPRPRTRKLLLKQLRPRTRKLLLKQPRPRTRKLLLKQPRPRTLRPLLKQLRPSQRPRLIKYQPDLTNCIGVSKVCRSNRLRRLSLSK